MLRVLVPFADDKAMDTVFGVFLQFFTEHAHKPPLQAGHIAVHIVQKVEWEFLYRLHVFIHVTQDSFNRIRYRPIIDAGLHPAVKAECHELPFQHGRRV